MTTIDQCPSSKGKQPIPETTPEPGRLNGRVNGRAYWRSVEEYAGTAEFKEFVEREFPAGASMLDGPTRRTFLKLMGAGFALAGAATLPGCRRPDRHIMPYSRNVPEDVIPGKATYYATAMSIPGGSAEGLLVETHEGRPTNIDGNPLHPINRGKVSDRAVASILNLYDPDRLTDIEYKLETAGGAAPTWDDFRQTWAPKHFSGHDATGGARLAFIVDKKTSPSRDAMRQAISQRWPRATWVEWDPTERRGAAEGARIALGRPARLHYRFARAERVVSFDSDFTKEGPAALVYARDFATTRKPMHAGDPMSRLYVFESRPSATGTTADHRVALSPGRVSAMAIAVARELVTLANARGGDAARKGAAIESALGAAIPAGDDIPAEAAKLVAEDLLEHTGSSIILAGDSQPAEIHALCLAMNDLLGNLGRTVLTAPMRDTEAANSAEALAELTAAMSEGRVDTLVTIGVNPVFDAPAEIGFAEAYANVNTTIAHSVLPNETTAAANTWVLNGTHELESWGDVEAWDGTLSVIQPMIQPIYEPALSELELLALLAGPDHGGAAEPDGFEIVSSVWANRLGLQTDSDRFTTLWRRVLHNGAAPNTAARPTGAEVNMRNVAGRVRAHTPAAAPTKDALEVAFRTGRVGDGRDANNGWLQELPDIASMVVWDNPAMMSPNTAESLGVLPVGGRDPYTGRQMPQARMAKLTLDGRTIELPVWVLPGMPDNVVSLTVGYGRSVAGRVGDGVGFDVYPVRKAGMWAATGATIARSGGTSTIASTQNHWSMEGRTSILRTLDKKWWDQHANGAEKEVTDEIYGQAYGTAELRLAERLGELSHTPKNISIYENPLNASHLDAAPGSVYSQGPQWGMTIDLSACLGCGTCTVACQSENNIPIVGRAEVAKGREMQWIRVDRYFVGDMDHPSRMMVQPVACVHCENAPCETVCPVNATVHGPMGTNNMAYNRCIGTRYCMNNCPYKVRRFNFFDWGQTKYNGGFIGEEAIAEITGDSLGDGHGGLDQKKFNKNFIPPRLREKLDEITKMRQNPDVTVRSRGVIEKCTYCIQRVNEARQEVKIRGIWTEAGQTAPIPDGFFQTACQAACPTDSIVFGDILDPASRVSQTRNNARSYMLLGYLNTRPRTTHMMRIDNPNEALLALLDPEDYEHRIAHNPLEHHGGGHGEGHDDGHHGDEGHGGEHHDDAHEDGAHGASAYIDRGRRAVEKGYALSLRVLAASNGVTA